MGKLTERINFLQGLASGMKLNPEKDSHKLILGMVDVLKEVGEAFEALAEAHGELSEYVDAIDQDLAELEDELYDEDEEDDGEEEDEEPVIEYECPHCGAEIEIDPDDDDFDEDAICPGCGGKLFPDIPEDESDEEEEAENGEEDAMSELESSLEELRRLDQNDD